MAMVLSMLSEAPEPQQGEQICILSLSQTEQGVFRMRAGSNMGRVIARWISECPLSISETALLWVSRFSWQVQVEEGSIDIQTVLDMIPHPAPLEPTDANGQPVHPLDILELLADSLPKKHPTSPETGAQLLLTGPQAQAPAAPPRLGPPGAPPVHPGMGATPGMPATPPSGMVPGFAGPAPRQEREEITHVLRDAARALKQGVSPSQVRRMLADAFDEDDDLADLDAYMLDDATDEVDPEVPPHVYALAEQLIRVNPGMTGEQALAQAEAITASQQSVSAAPATNPMPSAPQGIRPLGPSEPVPPELTTFQESPGDRAKLERTWQRAHIARERAEQASRHNGHAHQPVPVVAAPPSGQAISPEQVAQIQAQQAAEAQRAAQARAEAAQRASEAAAAAAAATEGLDDLDLDTSDETLAPLPPIDENTHHQGHVAEG
jgi:hypothetical protein